MRARWNFFICSLEHNWTHGVGECSYRRWRSLMTIVSKLITLSQALDLINIIWLLLYGCQSMHCWLNLLLEWLRGVTGLWRFQKIWDKTSVSHQGRTKSEISPGYVRTLTVTSSLRSMFVIILFHFKRLLDILDLVVYVFALVHCCLILL